MENIWEKNRMFFPAFFPLLARLHADLGSHVTDDDNTSLKPPLAQPWVHSHTQGARQACSPWPAKHPACSLLPVSELPGSDASLCNLTGV